jgi:hypothetical protein
MPLGGLGYTRTLAAARSDGASLASFTTAVSALPSHARYPMDPADWYEGRLLKITWAGRIGNVVTTQPTFTFEVRLGPTSTITAFTTGALLTSTTAHTTLPIYGEILLTRRALGAGTSANLMGQSWVISRALLDLGATADITTLGHPTLIAPETAPAVGTGFDSTIQNLLDFFVACSASNAANTFQLHQYALQDLGA